MSVLMEVPPASASMPSDVVAAASPRMSLSLMPASVADAAILWPISAILLSVVAEVLPRAVMALPRFSY